MTPSQIGDLLVKFAHESFAHGIYFDSKDQMDYFVILVKGFVDLAEKRSAGKSVDLKLDPFAPDQICSLMKRVKIFHDSPEDVTISDYLLYFKKDEPALEKGLESNPKRSWTKPYQFIGTSLRFLFLGALIGLGWDTYQSVTGSLASSVREMTSAEGRLQSYRSFMSGLLTYDPRIGPAGLETRRERAKQLYVGANSVMTDPEILGRDMMTMLDEAISAHSTALRMAQERNDLAEIWILLERLYFLETYYSDVWNSPVAHGTRLRIEHLFHTYDSSGEVRNILEANIFQEAFDIHYGGRTPDSWSNQFP